MASIEKTRAVVEQDETYDGRIVPTVKAELGRPVRVKAGATVQGSVYGETVSVQGGTVDGSVMAAEGAEFEDATIHGEVGSDGKVVASDTTVYGTITGQRVRLTESIVYGNVVGTDVILEDCIVIGLVTAERKFVAENTLCYTFKSYGETKLARLSVVLPQAAVEGEIQFATPVAVTGLGELDTGESTLPQMDESDIVEVGGSTYLSLSPRILNLEAVTDRLEELENVLEDVVSATSSEDMPPAKEILDTLGVDESQYPDI